MVDSQKVSALIIFLTTVKKYYFHAYDSVLGYMPRSSHIENNTGKGQGREVFIWLQAAFQ